MHLMKRELKMKLVKKLILGLIGISAGLLILVSCALIPPRLAVPPSESHIIASVTLYNPGKPIQPNQTIIVNDGLITDIRPALPGDGPPLCENCFAMPGLIDAHIHTPPSSAIGNRQLFSLLYLQHGVTSVRDLGQLDDDLPELVDRLNNGELAGPRMYHCGRILGGDPPKVPGAVSVLSEEDGAAIVRELADEGVDCIKVYDGLPGEAFKGISREAAALGLPLIGHTPHAVKMSDIRNFESQHYTGIPYLHRDAPKGWAYKSEDLMSLTPDEVAEVIGVMSANNIAFLPTNANAMSRLTVSDAERFPASAGFIHLPEFWEIAWPEIVTHPETEAEIMTELEALPFALSFIRQANEGGVDVLVGTDVLMPYVIPGEAMHQQLQLLSEALGSDEKALKAATQINGRHIDPGKIGEIRVGAYADLLLYREDPRGDLARIKQWDYALVGGRLYTREDVDAAVDRFDRYIRGPIYSFVMNTAYGFIASDYEDSGLAKH